jgi:hypothetical protein
VAENVSEEWLTVPDVCERLGLSPGKVHRLVEEKSLLGVKRDGVFRIPEVFVDGAEPLKDLRGTAVVLIDGGFTEESAVDWFLTENPDLGVSPVAALRQGRKAEVRRLAQSLAL